MKRHILGSMALAATLALTTAPAAEAATPAPRKLSLVAYTVTVEEPYAPATVCDDAQINCGSIAVEATFAGLSRIALPASNGPADANLLGTVDVTRVYGCQSAAGKRLHRYDTTVSETADLNTRRGSGLRFPRAGDTVTATTYAFLTDRQPGNCPADTTPMTYKIVAKHVRLELDSRIDAVADSTHRAPGRSAWVGAVPTPTPAAS